MGSHLYIRHGRRRSSFITELTVPRNTFSASTITELPLGSV